MIDHVIEKYLAVYAEAEARDLTLQQGYDHVVIIPAYRESAAAIQATWSRLTETQSTLFIVVINSPMADDPDCAGLYADLAGELPSSRQASDPCLHKSSSSGPDLLLIDRFSNKLAIPPRQGVGLARKTGCDIALALYARGQLRHPWISNTDADVVLPADYFESSVDLEADEVAAIILPFRHHATDPVLQSAVLLYELYMLNYASGLKWAGSPFGFPTVGSTIRVSARHYAAVRGFPRRNTGEDFYFLNKLRKTGRIQAVNSTPIEIAGRLSHRVPVGTGRAIEKIAAMTCPETDFQFEHPECFSALEKLLSCLGGIAREGGSLTSAPARALQGDSRLSAWADLTGLWDRIESKAAQNSGAEVLLKHLDDWFDALRTRQFVHHVRDRHHGTVNLAQLYEGAHCRGLAAQTPAALRQHFHQLIYGPRPR